MAVMQPSEPQSLTFRNGKLDFLCPEFNGGSRISEYEVHVQDNNEDWFLLETIPVKPLTADPNVPVDCKLYSLDFSQEREWGAQLKFNRFCLIC